MGYPSKTQPTTSPDNLDNIDFAVNSFIKKWLPEYYAHLVDSDQNDGQRLRNSIKRIAREHIQANYIPKQAVLDAIAATEKGSASPGRDNACYEIRTKLNLHDNQQRNES